MPEPLPYEVIPPPRAGRYTRLDDAFLEFMASLLDDMFSIPGTKLRFGLDPLIGLIPVLGDVITGAASFLIVFAGWQRRVPKVTLLRMIVNVAIDTLLGSIPIAGDMFDAAWKSNRMNLQLLQRSGQNVRKSQTWRDWLFLTGIAMALITLVAVPVLVFAAVLHLLRK